MKPIKSVLVFALLMVVYSIYGQPYDYAGNGLASTFRINGIPIDGGDNAYLRTSLASTASGNLSYNTSSNLWSISGNIWNDFSLLLHDASGLHFLGGDTFTGDLSNSAFRNTYTRFVILDNGRVGVGTGSPDFRLDVEENTAGNTTLQIRNPNTTVGSGTSLRLYPSSYGNRPSKISNVPDSFGSNFIFNIRKADASYLDAMYIRGDGNIGIGTNSPDAKLQIQNGNLTALFGADVGAETLTNNTRKFARIGSHHYLTAEEPVAGLIFDSKLNENIIWLGDGTNQFNTATELRFATASSSTNLGTNNLDNTRMVIKANGNVGIGITDPDELLVVDGRIKSEEVKVEVIGADYVFEESYDLQSLAEISQFIKANKHLPEVPSAQEMEQNGLNLGEMNILLLKKIEELTLHLINQQEHIDQQAEQIKVLMAEK